MIDDDTQLFLLSLYVVVAATKVCRYVP